MNYLIKLTIILAQYNTKLRAVYNTQNDIKQSILTYKNIALKFLLYMEKTDTKIIFGIPYKVSYLKVYGK